MGTRLSMSWRSNAVWPPAAISTGRSQGARRGRRRHRIVHLGAEGHLRSKAIASGSRSRASHASRRRAHAGGRRRRRGGSTTSLVLRKIGLAGAVAHAEELEQLSVLLPLLRTGASRMQREPSPPPSEASKGPPIDASASMSRASSRRRLARRSSHRSRADGCRRPPRARLGADRGGLDEGLGERFEEVGGSPREPLRRRS